MDKVVIEIKNRTKRPLEKPRELGEPNPEREESEKSDARNVLINRAYQEAKKMVVQAVNVSASRYFDLMEDYQSEVVFRNAKSAIGKASSFATVVGGSAMINPALGAIAAIGWVASQTIQSVGTWGNAMLQVANQNSQTRFMQDRYSLIDNGRGTEN